MIQPQSYLRVADNTGARELMCIRVLGGGKQRAAGVGDIIIAVVKDASPNMPIKKSDIVRAVIVRTRKMFVELMGLVFDLMKMQQLLLIKIITHAERAFSAQLLVNFVMAISQKLFHSHLKYYNFKFLFKVKNFSASNFK